MNMNHYVEVVTTREVKKMENNFRYTSDSRAVYSYAILPFDLNNGGSLYGARTLEILDNLSGTVASRHTRTNLTTASVDRFDFIHPIKLGHILIAESFVSGTGKRSLEICTLFYAEDTKDGSKILAALGFNTFTVLNVPEGYVVPRIVPETEIEKKICQEYEKRRQWAKERREETTRIENLIEEIHKN